MILSPTLFQVETRIHFTFRSKLNFVLAGGETVCGVHFCIWGANDVEFLPLLVPRQWTIISLDGKLTQINIGPNSCMQLVS